MMKFTVLFLSILLLISRSYSDNSTHIYGVGEAYGNALLSITNLDGSNPQEILLTNGINANYANSVAVTPSYVYIGGIAQIDNFYNATLWITPLDGSSVAQFPLPNESFSNIGGSTSIAVNSSHVYIVASDVFGNNGFWISNLDGSNIQQITSLPNLSNGALTGVAITSNYVYIVGSDSSGNAALWITTLDGSNAQEIIVSSHAQAYSVAVNSTHLFISGFDISSSNGTLWITDLNGSNIQNKSLTGDGVSGTSSPINIALTSSNVYLTGLNFSSNTSPYSDTLLWITNLDGSNVKTIILPNSTNENNYIRGAGVAINGSTVYVIGRDSSNNAAIWTTGLDGSNPTELIHLTGGDSAGYGIAIFPTTPTEPITTQLLQSIIKYSPFVPLLR